jgi:hypothetical protein
VVPEKLSEPVNVDIVSNLEKIKVVMDCFISHNIIEFRGRRMR